MSEGLTHAGLVGELESLAYLLHGAEAPVFMDVPGNNSQIKPPLIGGYFPDLFMPRPQTLIGEAKTKTDLDTMHTREQLFAFLQYLASFDDSLFVLAVPLYAWNYGKSVIRKLRKDANAESVTALCIYQNYSQMNATLPLRAGRV